MGVWPLGNAAERKFRLGGADSCTAWQFLQVHRRLLGLNRRYQIHDQATRIVGPDHYGWWLDQGDLYKAVLSHPDREELLSQPVSRA